MELRSFVPIRAAGSREANLGVSYVKITGLAQAVVPFLEIPVSAVSVGSVE
ncbi:hypothetical protein AB0B45_15670 [Nonomuraea sp. NPDC049152]|uniref:hypothetical protein n=1 Tax=Nonomuraea sp. NPDC049152 TaxID=3154350 RepID=UPI0033C2BB54